MKKIFGGILFLLGATVCGCSNNKQTEKNQTAADSVASARYAQRGKRARLLGHL